MWTVGGKARPALADAARTAGLVLLGLQDANKTLADILFVFDDENAGLEAGREQGGSEIR